MPEQIEAPDGIWVDAPTLYQSREWGIIRGAPRVDGAGNKYELSLFAKWNATIAYLRKYSPTGAILGKWNIVFAGAPHTTNYADPRWNGSGKMDDIGMCPAGRFMLVALYGHETDTERQNPLAEVLIDVDYRPFGAGQNPENGGYPVQTAGSEPNPEPQPEGGLSAEDKEWMHNQLLGSPAGTPFRQLWGAGGDIRIGIWQKVGDWFRDFFADPNTLPVENGVRGKVEQAQRNWFRFHNWALSREAAEKYPEAAQYQANYFAYHRNAAANVWFNILNGIDEPGSTWNRDRRAEWIELYQEAIRTMPQTEEDH